MIAENDNASTGNTSILGMGVRIIPYEGTEGKDFSKGTGESRNATRTLARTARKGYDRYQLRRKLLVDALVKNNMMPGELLMKAPKMDLWALRSKAALGEITPCELGRLLLWLNQKRGYKSSRSDANLDKKDTDYVAAVKSRHERLRTDNLTIGQFFFKELSNNEYFRVKENVFPREAYIEEFDTICSKQRFLSDELVAKIRNEIIYYQRPLKSQKGLVSVCEFEGFYTTKNGKEYFVGPKVAPKSSPLFQVAKMWENINNIQLSTSKGDDITISLEQKQAIFKHLDNNEKLTVTDLTKILGFKKGQFTVNKQISKGINGNITKVAIQKVLGGNKAYDQLLNFNIKIDTKDGCGYVYDKKTGEVLREKPILVVNTRIEEEPLYRVWHTIYSIPDIEICSRTLQHKFGIDEATARELAAIDFTRQGYGNKSAKAIRKIIPYLSEGDLYNEAMSFAGYDHSNSLTKDQNLNRKILEELKPIAKNSLRQPIVEKILNQMVNVVNAIIKKYGKPDEIRIELARELKQSKEERNDTEKAITKRERENENITKRLAEYGLRATRNNIIKWRLYEEIDNEDKKLNAMCIYCGQPISLTEAIKGEDVDIEHIIPKAKLFDDSQSNKTLAHRHCNSTKNNRTAYDFMKSKPEQVFNDYLERVNTLYNNHIIGKSKRDKLLMTESKIPNNFIDRQLRESQYIARKSREILQTICYTVWATSGSVTAVLRHLWGWDDVTMNLQLPKYKELQESTGTTFIETVEWESEKGKNKHTKEIIKGWSKRDDHRHHAVDALVIACTRQGFIQRINTLNASRTRDEMYKTVEQYGQKFKEKLTLLEQYLITQQPITVKEVEHAVANILISLKPGKKVAVKGTRKVGKRGKKRVVQTGIIIPRGSLSEESVYGRIKTIEQKKPVKYLFEHPELIFKPYIKKLVELRMEEHGQDAKKALASLKKDPIYLNPEKTILLEYATCFAEEYVIKYKVDVNFNKTEKVIDQGIREILQNRLAKFGGKEKEAFKDVLTTDKTIKKWYEDEGLERPILSVRCFTGLASLVTVRKNNTGKDISFVKSGNNHHIAIYQNAEGTPSTHLCTFWHAVDRKRFGLPIIIKDTSIMWDNIFSESDNKYPEDFLEKLPASGLILKESLQQNEMFVFNLQRDELKLAIANKNFKLITDNLYRLQKLTIKPSSGQVDIVFRHHLETQIIDDNFSKTSRRYINIQSLKAYFDLIPNKVIIGLTGDIVLAE